MRETIPVFMLFESASCGSVSKDQGGVSLHPRQFAAASHYSALGGMTF